MGLKATIKFIELFEDGIEKTILSPRCASQNAKFIIREERTFACNSYDYVNFVFVDRENKNAKIGINGIAACKAAIIGHAADYQLVLEVLDDKMRKHEYCRHNDIRYNMTPLTGPKSFEPLFSDWNLKHPLESIVKDLNLIEKVGIDVFSSIFDLNEKNRRLEQKLKIANRDILLMNQGISCIGLISISEGTDSIEPYAFECFNKLNTLILPSSLTEIKDWGLYSNSITTIYIKARIPPKLAFFSFGENRSIPCLKIYVPNGASERYERAWGFRDKPRKEFTFIEYDFEHGPNLLPLEDNS